MLTRYLLPVALALTTSPLLADEVTTEFLEQPGVVWVSADLPIAVEAGLIIPLIPYARFADGEVETGFLARNAAIFSTACDDLMTCDTITQQGADRRGGYTLSDGVVSSMADPLGEWVFDRADPETRFAIATSAFLPSGQTLLSRDGAHLIQSRAEGPRTYHAVSEAEIWDAFNIPFALNVAVSQSYECTTDALDRFRTRSVENETPEDAAFAAFLRVTRWLAGLDMETRLLRTHRLDVTPEDLPPAEAERLEQMKLTSAAGNLALSTLARDIATTGAITEETRLSIQDYLEVFTGQAHDPDALAADFAKHAADLEAAASIMAAFMTSTEDAVIDRYKRVICDR